MILRRPRLRLPTLIDEEDGLKLFFILAASILVVWAFGVVGFAAGLAVHLFWIGVGVR